MNISSKQSVVQPQLVKIGASRQIAIPKKISDKLRLVPGDYVEIALQDDRLVLTPKAFIEKRLAEGLRDIARGKTHGPFSSMKAIARALDTA